jgi:long-chain acyl-CoA synthetase
VAILLPNGFDAMTIDQACLRCGYVPVLCMPSTMPAALPTSWPIRGVLAGRGRCQGLAENLCYRSGPAGTPGRYSRTARPYQRVTERLSHTCRTSRAKSVKTLQRKPLIVLSAWLQAGQRHTSALPLPPKKTELAGIVYTSGTTESPRGSCSLMTTWSATCTR